jgi:hypothetical protein
MQQQQLLLLPQSRLRATDRLHTVLEFSSSFMLREALTELRRVIFGSIIAPSVKTELLYRDNYSRLKG